MQALFAFGAYGEARREIVFDCLQEFVFAVRHRFRQSSKNLLQAL